MHDMPILQTEYLLVDITSQLQLDLPLSLIPES